VFRYLPLILKNCWRNRRRTTLTVVSVGVSMCLLGVMMYLYHAFYLSDPAPEEALRLVARNRVSLTLQMPEFYRDKIRQIPGVREVMISQWYGGVYKDARDPKNFFARFAVDADKLFTMYSEFRIPEEQKKAFLRERTACVVGRDLANKFNFKEGDRITIVGDFFPGRMEFTVRGIFDSPRVSDLLYFHREYMEESLPVAQRGNAGSFYVLVDDPSNVTRVANAIDDQFRNATVQTRTENEQAFILNFMSFLGNVKMFLISICGAVMFTVLLVSANTMAMSVRERVREVGVLKTLGFSRGNILTIILGEACGISLAGGAIGFVLSILLAGGVRSSPAGQFLPSTSPVDPAVAAACIAAAVAIGLISAFVPAWGAARTNIVEALRSTD
jgi:putative ABC transport system permease protein